YSEAIRDIASQQHVLFVDLFTPSSELYTKSSKPLTIDGVHLNEVGNHLLAPVIVRALLPDAMAKHNAAPMEKIRAAVLDKNFYWFNRYRTVDGYNVYGGRSQLKFVDDVKNWDILQREMEVLDVMTANRDQRIWAVAQKKELAVDDSNAPALIPVKSNKLGA